MSVTPSLQEIFQTPVTTIHRSKTFFQHQSLLSIAPRHSSNTGHYYPSLQDILPTPVTTIHRSKTFFQHQSLLSIAPRHSFNTSHYYPSLQDILPTPVITIHRSKTFFQHQSYHRQDILQDIAPRHSSSPIFPGFEEPTKWTDHAVRCSVMSLLKEMSQSALAKLCPLTQSTISNIANWKYSNKISADKCKEFGDWYQQYMPNSKNFHDGPAPRDSRLTFHPEHEIPVLRKWYKTCKNPSDKKLTYFADELNKGHVRQERPKITVAKIKMWWKNERQREKRNRQKQTSSETIETPHYGNTKSNKSSKISSKSEQTIGLLDSSPLANPCQVSATSHDLQPRDSSLSSQSFSEDKSSGNANITSTAAASNQNAQQNQILPLSPEPLTGQFKSPSSYDRFIF